MQTNPLLPSFIKRFIPIVSVLQVSYQSKGILGEKNILKPFIEEKLAEEEPHCLINL